MKQIPYEAYRNKRVLITGGAGFIGSNFIRKVANDHNYRFVGVDNIKDAQPLSSYTWKDNSLMIFGSEGVGLTPTMQSYCDDMIYIKQRGSVRSLNAAVASGIIMNHFATQYESFHSQLPTTKVIGL